MTRVEFVAELRAKLRRLSEADVQKTVDYYSEIINDRMDEGETEEEAVSALGPVDDIVTKVLADSPVYVRPESTAPKSVSKKRGMTVIEIILIVLGFPIWFPVVVTVASLALVVYILAWVVLIVLAAVIVALVAGILAGIVAGVARGSLFMVGCGLACAGLAILAYLGVSALFKSFFNAHKKSLSPVKERVKNVFKDARASVRSFIDKHWL